MDFGVIWIIIVIGIFLFNLFSGSEDSSSDIQEHINENAFTVTVKKIDIIITVRTITIDELVNDKSTLPAFNSI